MHTKSRWLEEIIVLLSTSHNEINLLMTLKIKLPKWTLKSELLIWSIRDKTFTINSSPNYFSLLEIEQIFSTILSWSWLYFFGLYLVHFLLKLNKHFGFSNPILFLCLYTKVIRLWYRYQINDKNRKELFVRKWKDTHSNCGDWWILFKFANFFNIAFVCLRIPNDWTPK